MEVSRIHARDRLGVVLFKERHGDFLAETQMQFKLPRRTTLVYGPASLSIGLPFGTYFVDGYRLRRYPLIGGWINRHGEPAVISHAKEATRRCECVQLALDRCA